MKRVHHDAVGHGLHKLLKRKQVVVPVHVRHTREQGVRGARAEGYQQQELPGSCHRRGVKHTDGGCQTLRRLGDHRLVETLQFLRRILQERAVCKLADVRLPSSRRRVDELGRSEKQQPRRQKHMGGRPAAHHASHAPRTARSTNASELRSHQWPPHCGSTVHGTQSLPLLQACSMHPIHWAPCRGEGVVVTVTSNVQ
jgi:hypothetical protein